MSILFFCMLVYIQDGIETEQLIIDQVKPEFDTAMSLFKSVQREDSRAGFERLVEKLSLKADRNEDENLMLSECYKHLAILSFPEGTEGYFKKMIELDPGTLIPAGTMSPKFIRIFNELKYRLTGSILVSLVDSADPTSQQLTGGRLLLNNRFISNIQPGIPISILAGTHQVTLEMPNFDPLVQELEIVPGGTQTLNGVLYRNAADVGFVTYPAGVKVFLDGVEQGVTAGKAPLEYAEHLLKEGLSPSQASSIFTINNLKMGLCEVRFELPCYQTKKLSITVDSLKSYRFKPVILQPSQAFLTVKTAKQTAGIVYLDQERIGTLPLREKQICPGEYELRVQFPDGQFLKRVTVKENDQIELIAKPQPSLAWFGIQEKEGKAPSQPIDAWLNQLSTWNIIHIDSTDNTRITHDPHELLFSSSTINPEQARVLTQSIKADLFAAARVVRQKTIIRFLEVAFWSPLSSHVKVYAIDFREMNKFQSLLRNIDQPLDLLSPWLGLETIQVKGQNGLKILFVHPNGPAKGLAKEGDVISAVNGALVTTPKNCLPASYDPIKLKIADQSIAITPIKTIVELPFLPKQVCPQAIVARLSKLGSYAEDPLIRASADFNRARYFFFMNDFQQAFDLFTGISIPQAYGISSGTLHFYQGLCFQKLNLKTEAVNSFKSAINHPASTLFGPSGPRAKIWAETQLSILTTP
ncbi:MAG: hypothetical protein CSA81_05115 [Acidobacteria bacterium]|nr:MAG: hypothetical protein CSA81_05115 [Acidobacteriota bacterium]PIE91030.1 MAG: hypothetical protein CR997_02620 [Acidobacteriota bacterium]